MNVVFVGDSTVRYLFLAVVHLLRGNLVDWSHCRRECFWNERTYRSWVEYYNHSTTNGMWCDCVRESCCVNTHENWFATTPIGSMTYLQVYKGAKIKGRWLPGRPDAYRMPYTHYKPNWVYSMGEYGRVVPGIIDNLIWNIGWHECLNVTRLQQLHDNLRRNARHVIFLRTIGLARPCAYTPHTADIFGDYPAWTTSSFWDNNTHLNGPELHEVASTLVRRVLDPHTDKIHIKPRNRKRLLTPPTWF